MQQITRVRNISTTTAATAAALAGGWLGFNSFLLNGYGGESHRFMAGVLILIVAWRLAARTRLSAWAILAGWHLGAGSTIPSGWLAFFGNEWGWVGWVVWAGIAAAPALVFPARFIPLALAGASLVAALTPVGMMNPILAATSFFPGFGWPGLALAVALLSLPYIKHEKGFASGLILVAMAGTVINAQPDPLPPEGTWAVETREGLQPSLAVDWFGRQARINRDVLASIEGGSVLTVTPEGTVDSWDAWSEFAWMATAAEARRKGAMVLIGVYRHVPRSRIWQDGLLDLTSGAFYGATLPMPGSMWKPWDKAEHYPIDLSQLTRTIDTPRGEAAYLICFEELLLWPLAAKEAARDPVVLISTANQWFTTSTTSVTQARSVRLQSRLWGLPLVRAVNWPLSGRARPTPAEPFHSGRL